MWLSAGHIQHRFGRINPGHSVACGSIGVAKQPRPTPQIQDALGLLTCQIQIIPPVLRPAAVDIVKLGQ